MLQDARVANKVYVTLTAADLDKNLLDYGHSWLVGRKGHEQEEHARGEKQIEVLQERKTRREKDK